VCHTQLGIITTLNAALTIQATAISLAALRFRSAQVRGRRIAEFLRGRDSLAAQLRYDCYTGNRMENTGHSHHSTTHSHSHSHSHSSAASALDIDEAGLRHCVDGLVAHAARVVGLPSPPPPRCAAGPIVAPPRPTGVPLALAPQPQEEQGEAEHLPEPPHSGRGVVRVEQVEMAVSG